MEISESRKKFNLCYSQWEQSGLSCRSFCKREELKYTWFMSHKKAVRKQNRTKGFEQISISKPVVVQIKSSIEFHYPDGRYFIFGIGTDMHLIKALIK